MSHIQLFLWRVAPRSAFKWHIHLKKKKSQKQQAGKYCRHCFSCSGHHLQIESTDKLDMSQALNFLQTAVEHWVQQYESMLSATCKCYRAGVTCRNMEQTSSDVMLSWHLTPRCQRAIIAIMSSYSCLRKAKTPKHNNAWRARTEGRGVQDNRDTHIHAQSH